MTFTISEVAKQFDITTYTIRYYDKLGLLPQIKREKSGNRCFMQDDIDRLSVIRCLKNTGMTMGDIKQFVDLYCTEKNAVDQKRAMILKQKHILEEKISELNEFLEQSEFKLWFFDNIVKDGIEPPYSDESFKQWKEQFAQFKKNK